MISIKNALIASCIVLILVAIGPFLYRQNALQPNSVLETSIQKKTVKAHTDKSNTKKSIHTDNKTPGRFYQLIIDNNIFRPLGWRPPEKKLQYTLIGTTTASDGSNAKAFILEGRSNQLHTVKVGETLGNVSIKEILPKQVTLKEKGKDIKLKCGTFQFLR